jgi:hypothetical protein
MKTKFLILILCATCGLFGQDNLIPNPGFEEYFDCDYDLIRDPIEEVIPHWYTRLGRPRYFREECQEELPHSEFKGNGYLAMITLSSAVDEMTNSVRDYTVVSLINKLEVGRDYYLEYYGAFSFLNQSNHSHHGIRFTNEFINEINLENRGTPIIREDALTVDSVSFVEQGVWLKHNHCFSPDSSFQFMEVGNFSHRDSLIHSPFINNNGVGTFTSYDNFFLAEIEQEVHLDDYEEKICVGDCITLSTNHSLIAGTFEWQLPGSDVQTSSDSTVIVCYDEVGVYDVSLDIQHCTGDYSGDFPAAVTVGEAVDFDAPDDVFLCAQESFTFSIPDTLNVLWFDGTDSNEREITEPGVYEYELSRGGCSTSYTFTLEYSLPPATNVEELFACQGEGISFQGQTISQPTMIMDTMFSTVGCDSIYMMFLFDFYEDVDIEFDGTFSFCPDDAAEVSITSAHEEVIWSDGSTEWERNFDQPGSISVEAIDVNGCRVGASFDIIGLPGVSVTTMDMLDIDFETGIALDPLYEGEIVTYNWSGNNPALSCYDCPFPTLDLPNAGLYTIEVVDANGCKSISQLRISFSKVQIYLPTAININSNALENQTFYAQSNNDIIYSLQIFNRWGALVYEADQLFANDSNQGWRPQGTNPDVYVYVVKYVDDGGKEILLKGDVSVF